MSGSVYDLGCAKEKATKQSPLLCARTHAHQSNLNAKAQGREVQYNE